MRLSGDPPRRGESLSGRRSVERCCRADSESDGQVRACPPARQDQEPRSGFLPSAEGSVRPGLYPDSQEAELRVAQGRSRPADERHRSHDIHSGSRAQPSGALDSSRARRSCQGSSWSPIPRRPWNPRRRRGRGSQAEPIEVRGQEAQGVIGPVATSLSQVGRAGRRSALVSHAVLMAAARDN